MTACSAAADSPRTASPLSESTPTPGLPAVGADPAPINLDYAELLVHFVTSTAETFPGCESPTMRGFWTRNAPHIGLRHPFVLHLLLSAAAFHIAYLAARDGDSTDDDAQLLTPRRSRSEYFSLAQQHLTAGVSGFSAQLSRPGRDNCGALYLGAVLTSICTFAAGPTSRDDLLVCTADGHTHGRPEPTPPATPSSTPTSWMPFVHGVRLMHESFSPDVLFAGPMAPLMMRRPTTPLEKPVYARDGFARVEWEAALDGLRGFIAARAAAGPDGGDGSAEEKKPPSATAAAVALNALDNLIGIYAATYGRRRSGSGADGEIGYDGPPENQFVFGWLYRIEADFAACVRRHEPCALLVLAHYAVLLNGDAVQRAWCVEGWRDHIIARVGDFLASDGECSEWLRWPSEQVVPSGERPA
ncbi:hypothetical protein VTI74DRAFT_8399 [Chaetomium olivicolor]